MISPQASTLGEPVTDALAMGKASDVEQAATPRPAPATAALRQCAAAISEAICVKGVVALLLSVGIFLSAFFLLLHIRASGIKPDDPGTLVGEIEASFILSKPPTELASHTRMLEEEIYSEIGVPNSKVSVSMQAFLLEDFTYVKFGIVPDPINTSISGQSMRALRKTLIRLTLQQLNLSLTPSVFGDSFCLEMLGFPGGITMELPQYNSTVDFVDHIFNFTVDKSIHQIRAYVEEMKNNLESTLELPLDKGIYINLTNKNGSTVTPPVTVQVYISSSDYSIKPDRLKQLAELITESNSSNLGLNPLVFGRIKDLKLGPSLEIFVPSFAPTSSPMLIPFPSMTPNPRPDTPNLCECCSCSDLMKLLNATFPSHKLIQLHGGNTTDHKKNYSAVAAPIFFAPPPEQQRTCTTAQYLNDILPAAPSLGCSSSMPKLTT